MKSSFYSQLSPEETFKRIYSVDGMLLFDGWGPVPGISDVQIIDDITLLVQTSRGSVHKERIISFHNNKYFAMQISPPRWLCPLVHYFQEEWVFRGKPMGTMVERNFEIRMKKPFAWLRPLFALPLRRAIQKNNAKLSFHMLLRDSTKKSLPIR